MTVPAVTPQELIDKYDAILLDAYGVLVHSQGACEGAANFLELLEDSDTGFLVVTNDASRLPETCARDYYEMSGLSIAADRILTSGRLIVPHLHQCGLNDSPVSLLGTDDTAEYLKRDGFTLVPPGDDRAVAVVVADANGYDFVTDIESTLSMLVRAFDNNRSVELVCPNPDLLYPSGPDTVGFTAGAVAALIESALGSRYPGKDIQFARLGKPHRKLFEQAIELLNTDKVIMIGDKLTTDIRGAHDFGIDTVLVTNAVGDLEETLKHADVRPTYVMESLAG